AARRDRRTQQVDHDPTRAERAHRDGRRDHGDLPGDRYLSVHPTPGGSMRVRGVVAALAAWSMIGCGGSGSPLASSGPSYALEIVGGLDQVAEATLAVAEPPVVRVLRDGEPVAGERIDFRIIDGDGNGTIVVTSGADGVARMPIWVLGPVLGPQRLL